jgi:hypothetical protein
MRPHYLSALFHPKSVAMFGASETPDSVGQVVFKNLLDAGFEGQMRSVRTSISPSWPPQPERSRASSSSVVSTASSR